MQDNIPEALIAAFERHYDFPWNEPTLRNERLAWRAAWAEATKPCLHQIQEPAAAEQAAWHAGLDEGLAQATGSVSNATSQAAPAAVAVPSMTIAGALFDFCGYLTTLPRQQAITASEAHEASPMVEALEQWATKRNLQLDDADVKGWRAALAATPSASAVPDGWKRVPVVCTNEICCAIEREIDSQLAASGIAGPMHRQDGAEIWNAALAATPAAAIGNPISKQNQQVAEPVVLPEPVAFALEWTFDGEERGIRLYDDERHCRLDAESDGGVCSPLYTEQQVRALLATGGQAQAVTQDERAAWFALAMNAAAYIEDAANCLRDSDAKRSANGAVNHIREQCNALWESAPQAQEDARDVAQEVLMEHSGCGSNTQVDMLTVRLNPGDKVVMHKGRITQGFERANRAAIAAAKGD